MANNEFEILKREENIRIQAYTCGEWIVEIVQDDREETIEAWLRHKNIGDSQQMFGVPYGSFAFGHRYDFLQIVADNLETYIEQYTKRFLDE